MATLGADGITLACSGLNRPMPVRFESQTPKLRDAKEFLHQRCESPLGCSELTGKSATKAPGKKPALLACNATKRHVFQYRAMQNACNPDSRCSLACDASARDAKSLVMRVERCEPLSHHLAQEDGILTTSLRATISEYVMPLGYLRKSVRARLSLIVMQPNLFGSQVQEEQLLR